MHGESWVFIRYQKTTLTGMENRFMNIVGKLWIFFGFRIWGIGFLLAISYMVITTFLPFIPAVGVGAVIVVVGAIWIIRSLYYLFSSDDPRIDEN